VQHAQQKMIRREISHCWMHLLNRQAQFHLVPHEAQGQLSAGYRQESDPVAHNKKVLQT
jgi:hypothetical protein